MHLSLCRDLSLHFVESPALAPLEIQIDLVQQQKLANMVLVRFALELYDHLL